MGIIMKRTIVPLMAITMILFCGNALKAEKNVNSEAQHLNNMHKMGDTLVLKTIADRIVGMAQLGFVDTKTGLEYIKVSNAPANAELRFKNKFCNWHYTNGVLNMAMIHLGDFLNEPKYVELVKNHVAFGFDNYKYFEKRYNPKMHGNHWLYPLGELYNTKELDDFGAMISSTLDIYSHPNGEKRQEYIDYAKKMGDYLKNKKLRSDEGMFVRTFPRKNTLWGDDLYMSVPLLSRLYQLTGDEKYLDDAINQAILFDKYLWDDKLELYYHAYYLDNQQNGVSHWGRCNGWLAFAKIHLLDCMPKTHPKRQLIIDLLNKQIRGLARYQSVEGLWHQILDKNDSYLESSCSAMFIYSIARGINQGWLDNRFASVAITGWEGMKAYMLSKNGDMNNICEGTEVHDDLFYYYTRPYAKNEKHGLGALIDAGVEIIKLKSKNKEIVKDIVSRVNLNSEVE